jgi:cytochrome c-type biogenesis protein CcmH
MSLDPVLALREQILAIDRRHAGGDIDAETHARERALLEQRLVQAVVELPASNSATQGGQRQEPVLAAEPAEPALQPAAATGPASTPTGATPAAARPSRFDPRRWSARGYSALAFGLAGVALVATVAMQGTSSGPVAGDRASTASAGATTGAPGSSGAPAMGGAAGNAAAPHALGPEQIAAMTEQLAARLAKQPDDANGWAMLARSHAMSGQHAKAVEAFRKAEALRPDDPVLLADFADALAMTQQRSLLGEPLKLVQRALKADPANLKALSLAGTEAFDRRDYLAAIRYWESLQKAGGPDSVFVQQIQGGISEARQLAGLVPSAGGTGDPATGVKVKISRGSGGS